MEPNDPEDLKIVFNSLFDTFVQYLNSEVIIKHNFWFNEHRDEFLEGPSSEKRKTECLLDWISADDDAATIIQFTSTLRDLVCDSENVKSVVRNGSRDVVQQMQYLAKLLDGSLINELSKSDVVAILDVLLKKKIIIKKVYQQAKDIETPKECCIKMFKGLKGKSNWPFVFFDAVSKTRPDLIPPETLKVDKPNELSPELVEENTLAGRCNGGDEDPLLCLDELSDLTYDFVNDSLEPKVVLPESEWKARTIQLWIDSGNIDATSVVSWEGYEGQGLLNPYVSQCDAVDIDDDDRTTIHEETPDLCLRNYQKELAEPAVNGQNTIICAPTGSGKTIVAVQIILNHLQEPHDDKQTRKVVFFARTVSLVMQQYNVLRRFLPTEFKIISVTGDCNYSLHLDLIIPVFDVIVMTPRILENYFIRNRNEDVNVFSLMIFDECHHARKDEPYNMLMHFYLKRKQVIGLAGYHDRQTGVQLPQIVGLTASIGVENASSDDQAKENILQVCGNLDVATVSCVEKYTEELRETVHSSGEELKTLSEREVDDAVRSILRKIAELEGHMLDLAKKLKNRNLAGHLGNIPLNRKSIQYGHWTVGAKKLATSLPRTKCSETNGWKRLLIILSDYLSTYNVALQLHDLVLLRHVMEYLKKCFDQYRENKNCTQDEKSYFESFSELEEVLKDKLNAENPNLTLVKTCLLKYIVEKGETSRGIIFVKTRALAGALTSWLNSCGDGRIEDLKPMALTGTSATAAQGGMTLAQQNEVIQLFKNGDVRLLVATSVAQEGIDIPECNLVIRYNYDGNEITSIQTRGRSRKKGGMSIILAMPKIIQKEPLNKEMAERMYRAIKMIRCMDSSELHKKNEVHQQKILIKEKQREEMKKTMKSTMRRQHFKMVCHGCSSLVIDSDDIRTVCQAHHVVINRNIFRQTRTCLEKDVKCFDDILLVGPVKCISKLSAGGICNTKIGSLMIFSNIPFVVLGLTNFGFEEVDNENLVNFRKWKMVPYIIDEIGPKDFERYMPELNSVNNLGDSTSLSLQMKYGAVRNDSILQLFTANLTNTNDALEQQLQTSQDAHHLQTLQNLQGVRLNQTVPARSMVSSVQNKSTRLAHQASDKTMKDEHLHQRYSRTPFTALCDLEESKSQMLAVLYNASSFETKFSSMGPPILLSGDSQSQQDSVMTDITYSDKSSLISENLEQSYIETPQENDKSNPDSEDHEQSCNETPKESDIISINSEDQYHSCIETSKESEKIILNTGDQNQSCNDTDESTEASVKDLVETEDISSSTDLFKDT